MRDIGSDPPLESNPPSRQRVAVEWRREKEGREPESVIAYDDDLADGRDSNVSVPMVDIMRS